MAADEVVEDVEAPPASEEAPQQAVQEEPAPPDAPDAFSGESDEALARRLQEEEDGAGAADLESNPLMDNQERATTSSLAYADPSMRSTMAAGQARVARRRHLQEGHRTSKFVGDSAESVS